jgi:hypothetical protein
MVFNKHFCFIFTNPFLYICVATFLQPQPLSSWRLCLPSQGAFVFVCFQGETLCREMYYPFVAIWADFFLSEGGVSAAAAAATSTAATAATFGCTTTIVCGTTIIVAATAAAAAAASAAFTTPGECCE